MYNVARDSSWVPQQANTYSSSLILTAPSLSRSVSQHHSDFDDENLSNFTDGSEDSLPANMMIPSRKSGVRQYKHSRDEGFNATLDWLVFMVLITGLALGIGHFIGE